MAAQVTVADIGATLAIPFVLRPTRAGEAVVGTALVALCLLGVYGLGRWLGRMEKISTFRRTAKHRRWAIERLLRPGSVHVRKDSRHLWVLAV